MLVKKKIDKKKRRGKNGKKKPSQKAPAPHSWENVPCAHVRELGEEGAEDGQRRSHDAQHVAPANQTVARVVGGSEVPAVMAEEVGAEPKGEDQQAGRHDQNWNTQRGKDMGHGWQHVGIVVT